MLNSAFRLLNCWNICFNFSDLIKMDTTAHTNTECLRPFLCLRHKSPKAALCEEPQLGDMERPQLWAVQQSASAALSGCFFLSTLYTPRLIFLKRAMPVCAQDPHRLSPAGQSQLLSTPGPCSGLCGHSPSLRALCSSLTPPCPAPHHPSAILVTTGVSPSGPSSAPSSRSLSP